MVGGCEKRELTDDHERPAAFPCSLQISQEVSIATLCKKESINFAYLKGTESDRAKLPFRAVCKFAFGGIDLHINSPFFLPLCPFKLATVRRYGFLSGRPLGCLPCI
jgi:hypothetical protein